LSYILKSTFYYADDILQSKLGVFIKKPKIQKKT